MSNNGKTHFNISPVAKTTPFDNISNTFVSTDSQAAIEEAVFDIDNVLYVNKQSYPGHFSTIKAALDSISDSSTTNPYTIIIGPGIYTEDNSAGPLLIKESVTVKALAHSTVIIQPSDANQNLFTVASSNCRLQGMTIRNVTGATAIKVTSSPTTPFVIDFVSMTNCQICVHCESDSTATQVVLRNLRMISGSTTTYLLKIDALSGQESVVRIYSANLSDGDGTNFISGVNVSGAGARVDPNLLLLRSSVGAGKGIVVDDGAYIGLTSGSEIEGFDENLVFANSGSAPLGQIQGMALRSGVTYDLNVIHTGSTGSFSGIVRRSNIVNAAPTTFLLTYADPDNANFNNTGMLITRGLSPEMQNITTDGALHQLTRFDPHATFFLGSTAGTTLRLPDATTFSKGGHLYDVWNYASVDVDIEDYDGNFLATIKPNGHTVIVLRSISTSAGLWGLTYTIDNGNVFGAQLFYEEADAETSNNSPTTWANKVTLVTPALPLGDYLVQYQFNWRSANADRQLEFRVQQDAVDLDTGLPFTGSTADRQLISGFKRVQAVSGIKTYTLDFRRGASSTTVYMYNARLFVWRIA